MRKPWAQRGHRFAYHADDRNSLVKSKRARDRALDTVTRHVGDTMKFTVNPLKSSVDQPMNRKFLGFAVSRIRVKLKVTGKAIDQFRDRVRELNRRTRGNPIDKIVAALPSQ
ncbi:MAG TPA: hypothetical protein PKN13_00190 [Accumulibacter sp.]|nr:hypothetical protein [Accumulibacter sp.]HMX22172.1 hypothetical protein [Accumulibacter sp.]HMY05802.1 hypothetical protein [Accumulibacter sp.]HNC16946.1 hypothetical protein [Accumulibacter sp.]HND79030.1 hypothetical protein [Accumulibacter sp.]